MNENKRNSNQATVGELIEKLMKAYRLDGKLKEMDVLESWEEMMGKAIATRTKNLYIRNKTLFLTIDSSVMRDELSQGKTIIIQRVNDKAGFEIINNIFFA
jgi:predicted nucleic acid-binding Zn ribbon protein